VSHAHLASDFDAIVIGSGIGGLTTASLLAQLEHRRVLLLERHFKLGGYTQTFRRAGFTFDPGLHYVGDMQPGSQTRRFMDLVTGGGVDWFRMPDSFDVFVYPDLRFAQPGRPEAFRSRLIEQFPVEKDAIDTYLRDVRRASQWFERHLGLQLLPPGVRSVARLLPDRALALQTTGAYLDAHVRDPRLKALLASQWGDYGLPPAQSAFVMHALVIQSYLHGAWYPVGGAGRLAEEVARIVTATGGQVVVNHEVTDILVENGAARGVKAIRRHGQRASNEVVEFRAPLVVSDAGALATFCRLLPERVGARERQVLSSLQLPRGMVALYLGLREHPSRIGLGGENYWLYSGYDHDAAYAGAHRLLDGEVQGCYITFPTTRDPLAAAHTAQLLTWADPDEFAAWRDQPWHARDAAYARLKEQIADALLDFAEARLPGLRDLVVYRELATPLSFEHFTGHARGAVYGLPATPRRFAMRSPGPRTSVHGLLLTGCDVGTLGIIGAMMGGVMSAATALGPLGFPRITAAAARQNVPVQHPDRGRLRHASA
jgi:phytoene dehydrogenase-like protein